MRGRREEITRKRDLTRERDLSCERDLPCTQDLPICHIVSGSSHGTLSVPSAPGIIGTIVPFADLAAAGDTPFLAAASGPAAGKVLGKI